MRGVGDRRAGIELDEIKENENVYEELDKKCINSDTYDNEKTEKKTKKENMDTTKVVIVLLCVVVAALVVAVATVSSVVYFGVTDGGWTDWEDWRACSVTCGTGFTTRIRTCSNPRPSIMGRYCDGTSLQVQSCNNTSCSVTDGGWADWGVCSVTCGGGFTTRMLQCANPRPSITGRFCDGTSLQVQSCNNTACSGSSAAVFVYNTTDDSGHPLHFQNAFFNSDNAFNMISSIFECKQEGVYFFVNTISRKKGCSGSTYCSFYINDERSSFAGYADSIDDDSYPSGTEAVLHYLKPGDRVYIGGCRNASCIDSSSSFTGFIINAVY
ncbi:uncharacterized protein LOC123541758 isoform X3 [Mercenaria mercenaria]|uniref:uncharacterized protein LOC123541758 isoform X3 n=1 Tax=Mercenaria mercenaria TaxID=6596 RepID=UPI00234F6081|nr:uncharacterized protein LOC123541758 isoform X3 [Mercenaria mercenaria]